MTLVYVGIFGLIIGSFLNVAIFRVPRKLSVISPMRSFCPHCNNQLRSVDNIPVVSWLLLGAKCRNCKIPISGQYPLVELLSALAAAFTYLYFGLTPSSVVIYVLLSALIVITFIDLEFKIIPNVISYPGITLGLILGIVSQYSGIFFPPLTQSALDSLLGMLAGGGFFYLIRLFYFIATKRDGLGGGDIKLMAMTGAILGIRSVATTIFLGSLLGSIVGISLMIIGRGGRHSEIPFGPYLSIGAILYIFLDINWLGF